jgi:hypothetical protein
VKVFFLLVGNPGNEVGVYAKRAQARKARASCHCRSVCGPLFTLPYDQAHAWLKRKKIVRGIHTVYFHIEPNMRRLS